MEYLETNGFCETELSDEDLVLLLSWLVDVNTCIRQTWHNCLTKMDVERLERVTKLLTVTNAVQSSFVLCSVIDFHIEWKELLTRVGGDGESGFSLLLKANNLECINMLYDGGLRQSDFSSMHWVSLLNYEKSKGTSELKRFAAVVMQEPVEMAIAV
ncbi:hypothetical protein [Shewanella colwelliana]|uniref:hypothetical protein n=1 Tax=Shewanella colwelliana TaxID=23 RepID=UPI0022B0354F|nr:hypothetical protein [Shewanella colwelliana]MCZ4337740.1 hypothetical protein [Shewanella colwelliana]